MHVFLMLSIVGTCCGCHIWLTGDSLIINNYLPLEVIFHFPVVIIHVVALTHRSIMSPLFPSHTSATL
uniref:Uncharacterized protein n=1 Tax=Anguilla anguilla TaxID=7936 RepID=A0A0E9Y147_ANGAN